MDTACGGSPRRRGRPSFFEAGYWDDEEPAAPAALDEEAWAAELSAALGYAVRVDFTRARSAPVQLRHPKRNDLRQDPALRGGWIVRLHRMFAEAPPEVRADLASWIRVGRRARRACRELDAWMDMRLRELPPRPRRRVTLDTEGAVHDLLALRDSLLGAEFSPDFGDDSPPPDITWGRRGPSKTRGRLQLGSYVPHRHLVRVHPVLDQRAVPEWLVRYVLFHELLHAALPREVDAAGRVRHHGPEFRRRESAYPDYQRALAWEAAHLGKLLRSARRGVALARKKELP